MLLWYALRLSLQSLQFVNIVFVYNQSFCPNILESTFSGFLYFVDHPGVI